MNGSSTALSSTAPVPLRKRRKAWRPSFWGVIFLVTLAAGAYATWIRFSRGLGASTHLSDAFPWGLWIGFDVLCGVGLAAGGFTMAATVHLFNIHRMKPVVRPAILTAFLGYLLVVGALSSTWGSRGGSGTRLSCGTRTR